MGLPNFKIERYQKNNFYTQDIKYEDLIESLKQIGKIL